MNYEFAQKNHWRNRVWNQISDRLKKKGIDRRDAIVLYLAAEQDLDRETALKKGFRNENLIAIDRDLEAVKKIRAAGNLALHGNINEIIAAWPSRTPVAAVICDFTGGLYPGYCDNFFVFEHLPALRNSIFVVNLLRGRDQQVNTWRSGLEALVGVIKKHFRPDLISEKHRGAQLVAGKLLRSLNPKDFRHQIVDRIFNFITFADPIFDSYPSGVQRFDWVVWNALPVVPASAEVDPIKNTVSPQISAVLAHRTRRIAA
jgi:hypothetical protein